ncbi:hypothetical protein PMAYCL1PPCAC_19043, partial [Pristionchus mayeri]
LDWNWESSLLNFRYPGRASNDFGGETFSVEFFRLLLLGNVCFLGWRWRSYGNHGHLCLHVNVGLEDGWREGSRGVDCLNAQGQIGASIDDGSRGSVALRLLVACPDGEVARLLFVHPSVLVLEGLVDRNEHFGESSGVRLGHG